MPTNSYKDRARRLIYPGLERAHENDEKMVACLAHALQRLDNLTTEGETKPKLGKE